WSPLKWMAAPTVDAARAVIFPRRWSRFLPARPLCGQARREAFRARERFAIPRCRPGSPMPALPMLDSCRADNAGRAAPAVLAAIARAPSAALHDRLPVL